MMPTATCKHGHRFTAQNTYWAKRPDDPAKRYRQCKTCHRASTLRSMNLKYRRFPEYREAIKAKSLARYYERKKQTPEQHA